MVTALNEEISNWQESGALASNILAIKNLHYLRVYFFVQDGITKMGGLIC